MKRALSLIIALGLTVSLGTAAIAETPKGLSPSGRYVYGLVLCETALQLDCVESVEFFENGKYVPGLYEGLANEGNVQTDPMGNKRSYLGTKWETSAETGSKKFELITSLGTKDRVVSKLRGVTRTGSHLTVNAAGPKDDYETRIRVKVRTSWIRPENVNMHAFDPDFSSQKIPGGMRWIFAGSASKAGYFKSGNVGAHIAAGDAADFEQPLLDFSIQHAGTSTKDSWFDPKCAASGYPIASSNAASGGRAFWDPRTKSLDFQIAAPHRDSTGALNRGFFYLTVNKAYMKCMWPNSGLDKANSFSVSVVNEDGTKQLATTLVSYKNGSLKVEAQNFHYSSPKIKLKGSKK